MRGSPGDLGVDRVTVGDDRRDQLAREAGGVPVALGFGQVALQDALGRPLSEVRLEDGRERQPATGPPAADAVSPRRHRPGR